MEIIRLPIWYLSTFWIYQKETDFTLLPVCRTRCSPFALYECSKETEQSILFHFTDGNSGSLRNVDKQLSE